MLRPRPRPIKQQQDYITKKSLLLQHACLLSKNNFVQKTSKNDMMTSNVWHCFCTYCTKNTGVYYISALSCHTAPVGHNSVGSKTKSIRPRPRPRPKLQNQDQDRGRSVTTQDSRVIWQTYLISIDHLELCDPLTLIFLLFLPVLGLPLHLELFVFLHLITGTLFL